MGKLVLLFVLVGIFCASCYAGSLTDLYNSEVTFAEYWTRPLGSFSSSSRKKRELPYRFKHAGVVVTTENNERWLIHKGNGYGGDWDTVITDAANMGSGWDREKCGVVNGHTVDDFMQAANIEIDYSLIFSNCQHAANDMWELVAWDYSC